jgi:hypothetical protein
MAGGDGTNASGQSGQGLLGMLINLLVAEKSGFDLGNMAELEQLKQFSDRMVQDAMQSMSAGATTASESAAAEKSS